MGDRVTWQVVGLGAGGHARVVIDILRTGPANIVALLDQNPTLWGTTVLGVKVVGGDDMLSRLRSDGVGHAFIGLGGAGDMRPRRRLHALARELGFEMMSGGQPTRIVSPHATI